jgi:hypothetical protein
MNKRFYQACIEDIQNNNCDEFEKEVLCDVFESMMKKTACTLARKAWFDLSDFETAKKCGVDEFTLTLEKYPHAGAEQWIGTFEAKGRTLKIIGTLEKA